mmetsp:Transcript_11348/g.46083  ORF Transcript_11348/g.46083 Transcript_11348/m.46083 type:complete len:280 (-) Transcript_11348:656-1495(-)
MAHGGMAAADTASVMQGVLREASESSSALLSACPTVDHVAMPVGPVPSYVSAWVGDGQEAGVAAVLRQYRPTPGIASFDFKLFLESRGVSLSQVWNATEPYDVATNFYWEVQQLLTGVEEEVRNLNGQSAEQRARVTQIAQAQARFRPVMPEEINIRLDVVNAHFNRLFDILITSFCKSVCALKAKYDPKKRRSLGKRAISVLNDYFEKHKDNPYPSESEKLALAQQAGITVLQLNYWLGNKRSRTKRKEQQRMHARKRFDLKEPECSGEQSEGPGDSS